ncbi:MAG TPA: 3-oxoacyl-[acyl-carrier-protein] reductase [Acidimicrobiia bacterium]
MSRVALVTGASRGIGRAIAQTLAAAGRQVAVNYATREDAAREVVEKIQADGGRAIAVGGDVSDQDSVERIFAKVKDELGPVEILVNNAGIKRDNLLLRMSADDFDQVLRVNLRSAFLCTRAAVRGMLRSRWGRIISVSSVAGLVGNAGQANYAASKAGLIGFSKSVAREVGSRGITVNVIAPGFVETEMTEDLAEPARRALKASISIERFGLPEEIAAAVVFLASEEASYLTGQVIAVDGGLAL